MKSFVMGLTWLRIIGSIFILWGLLNGHYQKTGLFVFFIVLSLTDFFDGYLARKFNVVSAQGKLLDPVADKVLVLSVFLPLLYFRVLPVWLIFGFLFRDFFISSLRSLASSFGVILQAQSIGKFKTVFQMCGLTFLLLPTGQAYIADMGFYLLILALALSILSTVQYSYHMLQFFKSEQKLS